MFFWLYLIVPCLTPSFQYIVKVVSESLDQILFLKRLNTLLLPEKMWQIAVNCCTTSMWKVEHKRFLDFFNEQDFVWPFQVIMTYLAVWEGKMMTKVLDTTFKKRNSSICLDLKSSDLTAHTFLTLQLICMCVHFTGLTPLSKIITITWMNFHQGNYIHILGSFSSSSHC